ncbi:MAG: PIN domain-containing protein [Pyrinomonadaceae bacterium]
MNSLDANIVLRFILRDIPEQSIKAEILVTTSLCYVSDVIVTEAAFVLERRVGISRRDTAFVLKKFLDLPTVKCNQLLLDDTINLFAATRNLSFPDCYAAVEARRSGNKLATFDKDLVKHGGIHVIEP